MLKLAWKELREHQFIWLTMVVMTVLLGFGLSRLAAPRNQADAELIAGLMILGMAVTYGVVCGSMMLAGEHEGGTLVYLDIFLGRRGLLWGGKALIGLLFVLAEALVVALVLGLLNQAPPGWMQKLIGQAGTFGLRGRAPEPPLSPDYWLMILPVVTLEAYAWGLFGSAIKRRVLPAAAIALLGAVPLWLLIVATSQPVFLGIRSLAAVSALLLSCSLFVSQTPEVALATLRPDEAAEPPRGLSDMWEQFSATLEATTSMSDPRRRVLELWEEIKHAERARARRPILDGPVQAIVEAPSFEVWRPREPPQAESPREVLWWLTLQQARTLLPILAAVALLYGFFVSWAGQVPWAVTLLLGVACGTAAFAPEQRDSSYQFLAAQHFPLATIWRFKILFWFTATVLLALVFDLGAFAFVLVKGFSRRGLVGPEDNLLARFHADGLRELMGPIHFYGIWLVYGFCTGQVVVWLCRKSIFALLLSVLGAGVTVSLWLPSLLCLGMSGWPMWVPPLTMLAATYLLMRAWAGGRIKERRPLAALVGFALIIVGWMGLNFGYRAWEIPDAGEPMDRVAFRASLPSAIDNVAGKKIQQACALINEPNDPWLVQIAELTRLPIGVIEVPRADGQLSSLEHWPACLKMAGTLQDLAFATTDPGPAFEYLAQILALSRNLRNKAALENYLAGVEAEEIALEGLDLWLARGKPAPALLEKVLDELNRHAAETPPPLDCLQTECFRSGGILDNPHVWTFFSARMRGREQQQWLGDSIAFSLQTPWEDERKTRLWRLVWAGLFRAMETPYWRLPQQSGTLAAEKDTTALILRGWLAPADGPGASMTQAALANLLDNSWLSDERLFCSMVRLRVAATRARWSVDAERQAVALALYQLRQGKPAPALQDLVPKYLPTGLPIDPYSGEAFHYRVSGGENIEMVGAVRPGQAILWSTGPDRMDNGGKMHGGHLADDEIANAPGGIDLITVVPYWP